MEMKRVVIIGGGFAGLAASKTLIAKGPGLEVILIDKKTTSDFLPELPDVIGRGVGPGRLLLDIEALSRKRGFAFLKGEVTSVDLAGRAVFLAERRVAYDYLLIASGTETNFYGQEKLRRYAYELDDVEDAKGLASKVRLGGFGTFLIGGGGYTGIEVATNLRLYCDRHNVKKDILIVERSPSLLAPLPLRIREYVLANLERLRIRVLVNTTVADIGEAATVLSTGEAFPRSMLIWAAGVQTGEFIRKLKVEKSPQGRIKVDKYLRIDERSFVAGDAANFIYKEMPLRMAVQFSIYEGRIAARNIVSSIRNRPLKKYRPVDLGYVVPMANDRSCGMVFGLFVSGHAATFLHYAMCLYRSFSPARAIGLLKDLLNRG